MGREIQMIPKDWFVFAERHKLFLGIVVFLMTLAVFLFFANWYGFSLIFQIFFIVLILTLLLTYFITTRYLADKKGRVLATAINSTENNSEHKISLLKNKFNLAIRTLKTSVLGLNYRGSAALYALPWYMIIGPAAAGKTSLLRQSGLNFPMASHEDIQVTGVGGTRSCDWWFSDQAIIIDTAGRYTTELNDQPEWLGFLKILKQYRRRLPLNGLVIALSLADILKSKPDTLQWHVNLIKERINEINQTLEFIIPTILVFTKVDLIEGFETFFHTLSSEDRQAVWGINLLGNAKFEEQAQNFEKNLEYLYQDLLVRRFDYLNLQQDLQTKQELADFPVQFHQAIPKITDLFKMLINKNPYQDNLCLSGVYFTSAFHEGISIQYSLDKNEDQFQESKAIKERQLKSYFIKSIFLERIFSERKLVRTGQWLFFSEIFNWFFIFMLAVILLAFVIIFGGYYFTNRTSYYRAADLSRKLIFAQSKEKFDPKFLSQELEFYGLYKSYQSRNFLRVSNSDLLLNPMSKILNQALNVNYFSKVQSGLTEQLNHYINSWPSYSNIERERFYQDYYENLKAYLLFGLVAKEKFPQESMVIAKIWLAQLQELDAASEPVKFNIFDLSSLVNFYFTQPIFPAGQVWQPDQKLISQAQKQLYKPDEIKIFYQNAIQEIASNLGALKITDLYDGSDSDLFYDNYVLSKAYSQENWIETVKPELINAAKEASRGDWVFAPAEKFKIFGSQKAVIPQQDFDENLAKKYETEFFDFYVRDYLNQWKSWLNEFKIHSFVSLSDAQSSFKIISSINSPFSSLLKAVSSELLIQDSDLNTEKLNTVGQILKTYAYRHNYLSALKLALPDL